jgi:hypothetical protein
VAITQTYRKPETVDIVGNLIQTINGSSIDLLDDAWTDNGDGTFTQSVCRTWWFKVGYEFADSVLPSKIHTITNIVKDTSITVTNDSAFTPTNNKIILPSLKYYHGTVINTNLELNGVQFTENCVPMVYFLEQYTETYFTNDSLLDREANIRLFFLESGNFQDWNTDEHYTNAIYYTRQILEYFVYEILFKTKGIYSDLIEDYDTTNRVNFGVYTTDRGNTNHIFDKELTGIELNITLPITKNYIDCYC